PIIGTPFSLNYATDRSTGYKPNNTVTIPLANGSFPGPIKSVNVNIEVAGRQFPINLDPAAGDTYRFQWDGKDRFGETASGRQQANIDVGYVYGAGAYELPSNNAVAFAEALGVAIGGVGIEGSRSRSEVTLSRRVSSPRTIIGTWDARAEGL